MGLGNFSNVGYPPDMHPCMAGVPDVEADL